MQSMFHRTWTLGDSYRSPERRRERVSYNRKALKIAAAEAEARATKTARLRALREATVTD